MKQQKNEVVSNDNGIRLRKSIYVRIKNSARAKYLLFLVQLILGYLAAISTVFCYVTAMDVNVDVKKLIWFSLGVNLLLGVMIWFGEYIYTTVPMLLLVGILYVYDHYQYIANGIYLTENNYIDALNLYYEKNYLRYVVGDCDQVQATTMFFGLVLCIVSCVIAYLLYIGKGKLLYLIGSLMFLVLPGICGELPAAWALLLYAVATCGILSVMSVPRGVSREFGVHLTNGHSRYGQFTGVSIGFLSCVILAILLFAGNLLISDEVYQNSIQRKDIKKELQSFADALGQGKVSNSSITQQISDLFHSTHANGNTGLGEGELNTKTSEISYGYSPQITLQIPSVEEPYYLKGYNGIHYDGSSWTGMTKEEEDKYAESLEQLYADGFATDMITEIIYEELMEEGSVTAAEVQGTKTEARLTYKNANKNFLYYPYYTNFWQNTQAAFFDSIDADYSESYIQPQTSELTYDFLDIELNLDLSEMIKLGAIAEEEGSIDAGLQEDLNTYEDMVYDIYLELPQERCARLIEEFAKETIYAKKNQGSGNRNGVDLESCVDYVKSYLAENTDYTLSPGVLPSDQDYIEYFVYENFLGYCAHYASAATVMLRAMGIPARYVEGYCISSSYFNAYATNEQGRQVLSYEIPSDESGYVDSYTITADDTCAHAWVEIYIDGMGWYPLDFTKSSDDTDSNAASQDPELQTDLSAEINNEEDTQEEQTEETEEKTDQEVGEEEKQEETVGEEEEAAKDELNATEESKSLEDEEETVPIEETTQEEGHKLPVQAVILSMGILAVVLGVYLKEQYRRNLVKNYLKDHNRSEKLVRMVGCLEQEWKASGINICLDEESAVRLITMKGETIPAQDMDSLRQSYLKAKYASTELDRQEFQEALRLVFQMHHRIEGSKPKIIKVLKSILHTDFLNIYKKLN